MAVSEADVQELAQALLGRNVAPEFLQQFMSLKTLPPFMTQCTTLGRQIHKTGVAASLDNPGVCPRPH